GPGGRGSCRARAASCGFTRCCRLGRSLVLPWTKLRKFNKAFALRMRASEAHQGNEKTAPMRSRDAKAFAWTRFSIRGLIVIVVAVALAFAIRSYVDPLFRYRLAVLKTSLAF